MSEPKTVKIRLLQTVRTDLPAIMSTASAQPGIYEAQSNPLGALSVRADDGSWLGVKPGEFEYLAEDAPIDTLINHKKLPVPLTADKFGLYIWGRDSIMVADFGMLRMRGWGYLTGAASLKLSEAEGIEIQKAWRAEIVRRCNVHDELLDMLHRIANTAGWVVEDMTDEILALVAKAEGK